MQTTTPQKTCRLVTLGCKVNQYETQLVKESLEQHGYREAEETETADLCVVNTCTVTSTGDSKSRQIVRQLARKNPGTQTIVMGCYATRDPEAVAGLPNVLEVVTDKRELPDILRRFGVVDMPSGVTRFDGRKRAFVKVQDGCILKCTYCIIPQVRPGLNSRSPDDIENEVRQLVGNGYKEIVISGIHVGHFGVDTTRGKSGLAPFRLWDLFERLDKIPGDWRMRLSSIEAAEINHDFIASAKNCEHLCPQFHPALQSGSNTVLRRMRRRYHVVCFLEKVEWMRDELNDPAFTTDVIVGFPGETDEEHQQTVDACRRAAFMKMHLFPFSARKGTPAADFPDQVDPEVQRRRMNELADLERELAEDFYRSRIGHQLEVLVERQSEFTDGFVRGTDRWYIPVELQAPESSIGKFITAKGESACRDHLRAMESEVTGAAI